MISTGSTFGGTGTFTVGSVRERRAVVYAAAWSPSSPAISVNKSAATVQLSLTACAANPGYIEVCSYVSPAMASRRSAALVPTNPASTASPAKCSPNSTWAVPANNRPTAPLSADAADAVGAAIGTATGSAAIPRTASTFFHLIMTTFRTACHRMRHVGDPQIGCPPFGRNALLPVSCHCAISILFRNKKLSPM